MNNSIPTSNRQLSNSPTIIPQGIPFGRFSPRLRDLLKRICSQELWDEAARYLRLQAVNNISIHRHSIRGLVSLDAGTITASSSSNSGSSTGKAPQGEATVSIKILPSHSTGQIYEPSRVETSCTCSNDSENENGETKPNIWCAHALAVIGSYYLSPSHKGELSTLAEHQTANDFSLYNKSFASAIAQSLTHLAVTQRERDVSIHGSTQQSNIKGAQHTPWFPEVQVMIDINRSELLVQVLFDGISQEAPFFPELESAVSARLLDRELLSTLIQQSVWDEREVCWRVNKTEAISALFALLSEYEGHVVSKNNNRLKISRDHATVKILIDWSSEVVRTTLKWEVLGKLTNKHGVLLGNSSELSSFNEHNENYDKPSWVKIGSTFYPVTASVVRLARFFNTSVNIDTPLSLAAPLALLPFEDLPLVIESNSEKRPEVITVQPDVSINVYVSPSHRNLNHEALTVSATRNHSTINNIEVELKVKCAGTKPPRKNNKNNKDSFVITQLDPISLGDIWGRLKKLGLLAINSGRSSSNQVNATTSSIFNNSKSKILETNQQVFLDNPELHESTWIAKGDIALEILHRPHAIFPENWEILSDKRVNATSSASIAPLQLIIALNSYQPENLNDVSTAQSYDLKISLLLRGTQVPLSLLFRHIKTLNDPNNETRWIDLENNAIARVPGGSLIRLVRALEPFEQNLKLAHSISRRITKLEALGLSTLDGNDGIQVILDDELRAARSQLTALTKFPQRTPPKSFNGKLRSYQKRAIGWIETLHSVGLGGILADEMGLGKTVQTLAYTAIIKDQSTNTGSSKSAPVLVIAPTSVTTNWLHEIAHFTPNLRALHYVGSRRKLTIKTFAKYDIIVTSYSLARIDCDELARQSFSMVVLDEAHYLKNPDSSTRKAIKSFIVPRRLALTGTPTENRPLELWSIADIVNPGYLGTRSLFRLDYEQPILTENNLNSQSSLRKRVAPFLLRRTKKDVLTELPEKLESTIYTAMTPEQRLIYERYATQCSAEVAAVIHAKGLSRARATILTVILRLRQIVNHPLSLPELENSGDTILSSGKFEAAKDLLLQAVYEKRKVLLFSQFRAMLNLFRRWLDESDIPYEYIDGNVRDRQERIDSFSTNPSIPIFLLSLKAGGVGINLTAADTVILYDPWWNPAVEAQAVDRAHRIGQTNHVNVYRLVTADSIEERIMELKERKKELTDALIGDTPSGALPITVEDLKRLLELPQE
jgi:SNF2 family DNA or RNA helicase